MIFPEEEHKVNCDVLKHIIENESYFIEDLAKENGLNPEISLGIAKLVLANSGSVLKLSEKQMHHFNKNVRPLVEDVPCRGLEDDGSCIENGCILDEELLNAYLEEDFRCSFCRYISEKYFENL